MTEIARDPKPFRIEPFRIARDAGPDAARLTRDALAGEVAEDFGPRAEESFALAARDAAGGWVGGVNGVIHWRWLYVAQFFVTPAARGRGLGLALLSEAEQLAHERRCVGVYLDTFSPRAEKFYLAQGFLVAGRIGNFPPGAARTFLSKPITPASA